MASLSLKHIYKVYTGGVRAVNDFNLEIKDKSFVVLVGPSGCGKSTTLRMIAGLEAITSGQLYIDNVCVNDLESKNRDIAMVFQSYALYPNMTVYQNMGFSLKLRHEKPEVIKEKVTRAAEVLEISDLLDRKPKELSGGQRQRVALGRAIVRDPNVFLLDEPLSNLDAKLRVQMRTEITKLHEKLQTTFIYVTHDQVEAMTMGDTIVVMNKGFIQQADDPIALYEDPDNLFVATFLGSPQMNIIESTLDLSGGKVAVKLEGVQENRVEFSEENAKQIRALNLEDGKQVLFGIRPDYVRISDKGISAYVEAVEQLGDGTLIHSTIENHKRHVVIRTPLSGDVHVGDTIHLEFLKDKAYLFDKDNETSLIGMPSFNKLPCRLESKNIVIGKATLPLEDDFIEHQLDAAKDVDRHLLIKPGFIAIEPREDALKLSAKVDFVTKRTKYNLVYAHIEGVEEFVVYRMPLRQEIKSGDVMDIYLPLEKISIIDEEGNSLTSREVAYPNLAACSVSTEKGLTSIKIDGGETLVYPDMGLENGRYSLKLKQDGAEVIFDRKTAKSLKKEAKTPVKGSYLSVSCYDEEPAKTMNTIFAEIKGFKEYVTFRVPNDFSVYKMPKFKIVIPSDGFILEKQ